jgi:aminopeptidase N
MNKIQLYILLLSGLVTFAQQKISYNSPENIHYWKNHPPSKDYWQQDVAYEIKAEINDSSDILTANYYKLIYTNNSPQELKEIYFHLYENAFQPNSYYDNLWKNNKQTPKFGRHEIRGLGTTITGLMVNGEFVRTELDNTILKVYLNNPLKPSESLNVTCSFQTYYDQGSMRRRNKFYQSFGTKHYNGVHWYPIVCVYDKKFAWHTDQHLDKEFYANFGSFDVELTFPQEYIVEATGELLNKFEVLPDTLREKIDLKNFTKKPFNSPPSVVIPKEKGKTKTWKFYANNVHNFAFTADPTYRIDEKIWNGIKIISLVQEPHASKWVPSSAFTQKVMEIYSKDFGTYIWPKIIAADADDGMEYPMLTLDGGTYPQHQGLIAHEVGHMWFYGMLGSNETYRASLDEGFTQFATVWAMDKINGEKTARNVPNKYFQKFADSVQYRMENLYNPYIADAISGYDEPLNTHSSGFNGALRHGGSYRLVYYKTGVMLYNLKYVLGDSLFLKAMQHYVNKWKMAHPYPEDFRDAIIEYTQTDLNWFFDQWMETTKNIDYELGRIKPIKNPNTINDSLKTFEIEIKRIGRMQMPIDFIVIGKNGKKYKYHIPNTWFVKQTDATVLPKWYGWDLLNPTYKAVVTISGDYKEIIIDPDRLMADVDLMNNSLKISGKEITQFDHRVPNPVSWTKKKNFFRPDIWWNNFDGLQLGGNYYGNYFNQNYWEEYSLSWNSRLAQNNIPSSLQNQNQVVAAYVYNKLNLSKLWRQLYIYHEWHFNAGLGKYNIGFEKIFRKQDLRNPRYSKIFINHQMMHRDKQVWADYYLLYPEYWSVGEYNNSINMGIQRFYPIKNGGEGNWQLELRTPGINSGFNYSYLQFTTTNTHNISKLELKTRLYGRLGWGNTPMESALYLAGASPEQMYGNKLTRASGFVPSDWLGYGTETNHFQMGGGLNVRGFAGYLVPVSHNGQQYFNHVGRSGAAFNLELDFDKFIPLKGGKFTRNFHIDTYLFHDMGILSYQIPTENKERLGDLRMSSGVGTALTIKFGNLNIKPIVLRFDIPFIVNAAPASENNTQMRYVFGINRSF